MIKPFFSIILPTYNRGNMISKAVESVKNQGFENWELIIVDDGSTDNTKELIGDFINKDKRIKYYYQENSERSVARNNGISKARGDWICFLDSDDEYHFNHLDEFDKLIRSKNSNPGLYFSGVSYGVYQKEEQYYDHSGKNNLEFVLLNTIGVPRACCHKNILLKNQFDKNINVGEDKELWCRIVSKYPVFYHTDKSFIEIHHNLRTISIETCFKNKNTFEKIISSRDVKRNVSKRVIKICYSKLYFDIGLYYFKQNKKIVSVIYMLVSLIFDKRKFKFKLNIVIHILTKKKSSLYKLIND